jgi:Domain of unknown function (DUF4259)
MGAWTEDTFGNDTSCDWIGTFLENPGLDIVWEAINSVLEASDYLESDEACNCLAACELIARTQGKWGLKNSYSEKLDDWVQTNPMVVPNDLKIAADSAIKRILDSDSELPELWDDGGRNDAWHDAIDNLRERIKG